MVLQHRKTLWMKRCGRLLTHTGPIHTLGSRKACAAVSGTYRLPFATSEFLSTASTSFPQAAVRASRSL